MDDRIARQMLNRKFGGGVAALGLVMGLVSPAWAGGQAAPRPSSPAAASEPDEGDIVVTAQKREERLVEVPISISVIGSEQLDAATGRGVVDALVRVPGVAIVEGFQTGGANVTIRGVQANGNFSQGASPIAYYLDAVPFGFIRNAIAPDAAAFDLERVEVLRGPQGTLYGISALNGVVRVLTASANLSDFSAKGRIGGSATEHGGLNYRADAAINVPLIQDKLAARVTVGFQNNSGWIDKPNNRDANGSKASDVRLKVNAAPTERLRFELGSWFSRSRAEAPNMSNDQMINRSLIPEPINSDFDSVFLKATYEADGFTVSSSSSYLNYRLTSVLDTNTLASNTNVLDTNVSSKLFTQEVNVTSNGDGPLRWSIGGIYRNVRDETYQLRHTAQGDPTGGYLAPINFEELSQSYAFFGEATYQIIQDRLELTAGARYFHDQIKINEFSRITGNPANYPSTTPSGRPYVHSKNNFEKFTPRVALTWHPADRTTVYASYSQGFRSGLPQLPTVVTVNPTFKDAKPDTLTNYELGFKGDLFDRVLSVDAAVYYIDWKNIQQSVAVPLGTASFTGLVNGPSASGLGVDLGLTVRPTRRLTFGAAMSINDLKLDGDVLTVAGSPPVSTVLFPKDSRLVNSPKYVFGGNLDYSFPVGANGLEGLFSATANYTSKRVARFIINNVAVPVPGDNMWNAGARLGVKSTAGWTATLFVDNLTNEDGRVAGYIPSALERVDWLVRVRPRTWGLQLEMKM